MKNLFNKKNIGFLGIILVAAFSRLIPHPPNFTPIGGLAIFSGIYFDDKRAVFLPIFAMLISDLVLGFHSTMVFVYFGFLLMFFIGRFIRKKTNFKKLVLASIISSCLFFLITNFGVWLLFDMYSKNLNGLINCYLMALPFFRNTLLGDIFYSLLFFYSHQFLPVFLKKLAIC